jgi:sporulation protein YqfC
MDRRGLRKQLAQMLDVPTDALLDVPRITISGGDQVLVEGHHGLLEYTEDRVAAAGAGCRVLIKGQNLALAAMSGRDLVVTGQLWAVELE